MHTVFYTPVISSHAFIPPPANEFAANGITKSPSVDFPPARTPVPFTWLFPINPAMPLRTTGNAHRMIRFADSSRAPNKRAKSEFSNLVSLTLYDVLAEKRIRSLMYFISVPGIVACTPVSISWMVKRREICSSLGYKAKGCRSAKHPVSYLHCHLTNGVMLINPSGMAV